MRLPATEGDGVALVEGERIGIGGELHDETAFQYEDELVTVVFRPVLHDGAASILDHQRDERAVLIGRREGDVDTLGRREQDRPLAMPDDATPRRRRLGHRLGQIEPEVIQQRQETTKAHVGPSLLEQGEEGR